MSHADVQDYYGKVLQGSSDLKTNACCTAGDMPDALKKALSNIHDDVLTRYYGCGLIAPDVLEGTRVLDLGCGAGRDVYALAQMVGEAGFVAGVDMTEEQLAVARAHQDYHAKAFGYAASNVAFYKGYIEKLDDVPLDAGSFDIIVSNCVLNLAMDKPAVLREAYRLLKPGGEMYFSDVYADRRVPEALRADPVLYGECLSGALYWTDFEHMARAAGFADPRVVNHRRLAIIDPKLKAKVEPIRFASVTARLMKLDGLETACEDYGQAVIYKGGVEGMERVFILDAEHEIEAGRVFPVCGNTLAMLMETRFAPFFQVVGNGKTHFGVFPGCAAPDVFAETQDASGPAPVGGCC